MQLHDQQRYIQEQHAELVLAQQQLGDNIRGKKHYELHVHEEMQNVAKNYEQLELHAERMKNEREHQQHMSALAAAERQHEHMAT